MKKRFRKQCSFQVHWLHDDELKSWIQQVPNDIYSAKCRFCTGTLIALSNMGRQALTSHMKGKKHLKAVHSMTSSPAITHFLAKPSSSDTNRPGTSKTLQTLNETICFDETDICDKDNTPKTADETGICDKDNTPKTVNKTVDISETCSSSFVPLGERGMKKYLLNEQVTKSEILWAIHTVMSHISFRNAAAGVEIFKLMFTDSQIAQKMELQRTKVGYLITFGLAPYFKNEILNLAKNCSNFVVSFDESMNKISSKQQMDVLIRFWDESKNQVTTRYLTSAFLHSSKAEDLQRALLSSLDPLDIHCLIQISMDGPNVNLKLLKNFKVFLNEKGCDKKIIDFGTCGLHTVHNAFKGAIIATGWGVVKFLRGLYNHFKQSPARRGDFIRITDSAVFPKKFCAVRWLENVEVTQTAIDIIPNVKKYVETIAAEKSLAVKSNSYKVITECLKDPIIGPKLAFFMTLASDAEKFLTEFQTDWPYAPFLFSGLGELDKDIKNRYVKPEKVTVNVNVEDEDNLLSYKNVDLGFSTRSEIRKVKNAKELDIAAFRKDAKKGLKVFTKKLQDRSPLGYNITKDLSCLDPKVAVKDEGKQLFKNLLEHLVYSNRLSATTADKVARQFNEVVGQEKFAKESFEFVRSKTRLDHFWSTFLTNEYEFNDLRQLLKMVLIFSHGNAQVERGFSVNKECLIENLKEESLIGIRRVYDSVASHGGLKSLTITKSMSNFARNAHAKYKESLAVSRELEKKSKTVQNEQKRKKKLIHELKEKKAKLIEEAVKQSTQLEAQIKHLSNDV